MSRTAPQITRVEGDVMAVNSYLVHGPGGVVVVDGQLTISDARKVRAAVAAAGPLRAVLVTHAHPDHYAGIGELLDGADVPIVSTHAVAAVITRDDAVKNDIVGPMMGAEWPARRVFPNHLLDSGNSIELAGLTFAVTDVGPGESPADSIWALDEHTVFVGDLASHGAHSYLADGYADEWLGTLTRLEKELAPDATLYVGHGAPAGLELVEGQRRYIEAFIAAVEDNLGVGEEARIAAVAARMHEVLPAETLAFLMQLSVNPYAARLARPAG